jgi:hypothetical protein
MREQHDNIASIHQRIGAPLLGTLPYMATLSSETIAASLSLQR